MDPLQPDSDPRFLVRVITNANVPLRRYQLPPGDYLVGSAPSADILLPVSGVSRQHARIEVGEDGPLRLTDLGSRNGTFLDGVRTERAEIAHQVTVGFGPVLATVAPVDEMTDAVAVPARQPAPRQAAPAPAAPPGPLPDTLADRLAERTGLVVALLVRGSVTPADGALRLAREWQAVLAATRVEVVHQPAGAQRVTISVAAPQSPAGEPHAVEVTGEAGWQLAVLDAPAGAEAILRPLARVTLAALAAASTSAAPGRQAQPVRHAPGGAATRRARGAPRRPGPRQGRRGPRRRDPRPVPLDLPEEAQGPRRRLVSTRSHHLTFRRRRPPTVLLRQFFLAAVGGGPAISGACRTRGVTSTGASEARSPDEATPSSRKRRAPGSTRDSSEPTAWLYASTARVEARADRRRRAPASVPRRS